jgi:hypothetical protein
LLSVVYVEAYGYTSFDYDMDVYQEYLDRYVPYQPEFWNDPWEWIASLFSPSSGWTTIIIIVVLVLMFGFGGVIGVRRNSGGGGSSGGMGVFRRRR